MRSLSLARALPPSAEPVLVTRSGVPGLAAHADDAGIGVREIADAFPHPADLATVMTELSGADHSWAIVDGYHFDQRYYDALRGAGARVMVIDDGARLPRYDVDVLLDQNLGALQQPYHSAATLLLGPRFALLRPEFATLRAPLNATVANVLVAMGGADPSNTTRLAVEALLATGTRATMTVVIGAANRHAAELQHAYGARAGIELLVNVTQFAALAARADLAVVSVGGVMWEMACLNVPSVVVSAAPFQSAIAARVAAYGAHLFAGAHDELSVSALAEAIKPLLDDRDRRAVMARLGRQLIDGRGAKRTVSALIAPAAEWTLRPATVGDAEAVWEIAADPGVRQQAFTAGSFSFESHERWFADRIQRATSRIWVAERNGVIGGFVRYDLDGRAAVISFAVAAPFRGRGLGRLLLERTHRDACRELGAEVAHGSVLVDNAASQTAFLRAGFAETARATVHDRACVIYEAPAGGQS